MGTGGWKKGTVGRGKERREKKKLLNTIYHIPTIYNMEQEYIFEFFSFQLRGDKTPVKTAI